MSDIFRPEKPSPRLQQLRDILGHERASCFSCTKAFRDYMTGELDESDPLYHCPYLGRDVEPDPEKACWMPEFWKGFAAKLDVDLSVDGADWAAQKAHDAFCSAFLYGKRKTKETNDARG